MKLLPPIRCCFSQQSRVDVKRPLLLLTALLFTAVTMGRAQSQAKDDASAKADEPSTVIPVDSTAFVYSPGNWVGDAGRQGRLYRQTWNPGAYVRVTWETKTAKVTPVLTLDVSMYGPKFKPPVLACNLDGVWTSDLPCAAAIPITGLKGAGKHVLTVYVKRSEQVHRWGTPGASGTNVVRIAGLRVDADSKPGVDQAQTHWALIIGDSITEGIGAADLDGYSHLVGQALLSQGYEYCISACGWSGWIFRGDNPPGDVPGYYVVTDSSNGEGGQYHEQDSRWNKIDANHSLLDSRGHLSAYGQLGQEPSIIVINYGTNDAIHKSGASESDVRASIAQSLRALRAAAPAAHLFYIIPFGQYKAQDIEETVGAYKAAHSDDHRISIIDLGSDAAKALAANGYFGGLHPNPRGHATFAAQIIAQMIAALHDPEVQKQAAAPTFSKPQR